MLENATAGREGVTPLGIDVSEEIGEVPACDILCAKGAAAGCGLLVATAATGAGSRFEKSMKIVHCHLPAFAPTTTKPRTMQAAVRGMDYSGP